MRQLHVEDTSEWGCAMKPESHEVRQGGQQLPQRIEELEITL